MDAATRITPAPDYCPGCGGDVAAPPRAPHDGCSSQHDPAPANPWKGYQLSALELEHFAHAVDVSWNRGTSQSDAWRFGYCAGALLNMAALLEHVAPDLTAEMGLQLADARSLAGCESTDMITAWLVSHGKAPAGDVAQLREAGWSAGMGALCGYVYQLNYLLLLRTGQQS